jgi:hypothetical protein
MSPKEGSLEAALGDRVMHGRTVGHADGEDCSGSAVVDVEVGVDGRSRTGTGREESRDRGRGSGRGRAEVRGGLRNSSRDITTLSSV